MSGMGDATRYLDADGAPIGCVEKLRVLRENEAELRQTMQDAFEDGILMGVPAASMRDLLRQWVAEMNEPGA